MKTSVNKSALAIPTLLLLAALVILSVASGCKELTVVSADQQETVVKASKPFTPPADGVYMSMGRYLRYRQAVADEIQILSTTNK